MFDIVCNIGDIISENFLMSLFTILFLSINFYIIYSNCINENLTKKDELIKNSIKYAGLIFLPDPKDDKKDPVLKIELTELFKLCIQYKDFEKIKQLLIHPLSIIFLCYTYNDNEYYIHWTINERKKINFPIYNDELKTDITLFNIFNDSIIKHNNNNIIKHDVSDCIKKYSGPYFDYYKSIDIGLNCRFLWDHKRNQFIFNNNSDKLILTDILNNKNITCDIDDNLVSKIKES